jgi:Tfp pilus assembly protein PilO
MASVEEVITQLKRLRPEQVEEVARIIQDLSQAGCAEAPLHAAVPARVVDEAVQHGWPAELFTELIGSLPELERSAQPPMENRAGL